MPYDVVGISAILPNVGKVEEDVRAGAASTSPKATIVVGGHIANRPGLARPHRRRPRGARRGRRAGSARFLGEDASRPIRHPLIALRASARARWACPFGEGPGETAATLIPSVGCPLGCNFCSTSAMFGGKGRFVSFYETATNSSTSCAGIEKALEMRVVLRDGRELPAPPQARAAAAGADAGARQGLGALRLQLGQRAAPVHGRGARAASASPGSGWASRARTARTPSSTAPTRSRLVRELQAHRHPRPGLDDHRPAEHTPENIDAAIDHAVAHDTEFHQFMLYTPHARHAAARRAPGEGTLLSSGRVPGRRHPRAAALQLPAPAHPQRRGDGVPAAGVPPRLRAERAERHAHRAHAAARLAAPSRTTPTRACATRVAFETKDLPRSTRARSGRPSAGSRGRTPCSPRGCAATRRGDRAARSAGRPALAARLVGPGRARHAVARGAPAAPRPDLRAADLLRGEPRRGRAARGRRAGRRPRAAGSSRRPARGPKRSPEAGRRRPGRSGLRERLLVGGEARGVEREAVAQLAARRASPRRARSRCRPRGGRAR